MQDKNKDSFLKKTSEQIEDRVDEAIFEEAYEEYLKNGKNEQTCFGTLERSRYLI